ncbi:hypothetical protein [Legionella jamestowniensis]|uniref:Uncharacterized protein n=1 Tax=Legionella jamestowniensis TaxID=455 RepID=A0A0W0UK84_9GAMM|nr:hypothetical protein [Legionella jamestowniensis]KTD08318.1 hypothetical protein Ljam_2513 [Legionella jamestowniensis]SFL49673.1 hypothetical protein SAMN02746073_0450 [Legionella jamestowniensis DSM 19215]
MNRNRFSFFKREVAEAIKVGVTVAFGVAALAAFYGAYTQMFAESQNPTPGF